MRVELIIPIEWLKGKLKNDGYYFRMYRGQQVVQKCPTKWKDTPARKAARERFAAVAKMVKQMRQNSPKSKAKSQKQLWKIAMEAYDAANQ